MSGGGKKTLSLKIGEILIAFLTVSLKKGILNLIEHPSLRRYDSPPPIAAVSTTTM